MRPSYFFWLNSRWIESPPKSSRRRKVVEDKSTRILSDNLEVSGVTEGIRNPAKGETEFMKNRESALEPSWKAYASLEEEAHSAAGP